MFSVVGLISAMILIGVPKIESVKSIPRSYPFEVSGVDRSDRYENALQFAGEYSLAHFKNYKVLFVPGFLSDELLAMANWPFVGARLGSVFEAQMELLKAEGIEFEIIRTNSEECPEYNAPLILDAIDQSQKPLIFISHSRGGLDVLEAALQASVEQRSKIKGWFALQAPFQGTPLADVFLDDPSIRWLANAALRALGGSLDAVVSMSLAVRDRYLKARMPAIENLINDLPMISLSAWKPNEARKLDSTYELQRNYLESLGYETDGIVPWQSEILPHSHFVFIKGIDHTTTVHSSPFVDFDRVAMTKALFMMLEDDFALPIQ